MALAATDHGMSNSGAPSQRVTTFLILNLHCPSCAESINTSVNALRPKPVSVSHSIVSRSVTVRHGDSLSAAAIAKALREGGFEIYDKITDSQVGIDGSESSLQQHLGNDWVRHFHTAIEHWSWKSESLDSTDGEIKERHMRNCEQCRTEAKKAETTLSSLSADPQPQWGEEKMTGDGQPASGTARNIDTALALPSVVIDQQSGVGLFHASFTIGGMTCSSCVNNITHALDQSPWVREAHVNLLTNSASITFEGRGHLNAIIEAIEDVGYDATLGQMDELKSKENPTPKTHSGIWRASYAITGMTCSSCVGTITRALQQHDWVSSADINLLSNSAVVIFNGRDNLPRIRESIEDAGYEAALDAIVEVNGEPTINVLRQVAIRVEGMYCAHCPTRVTDAMDTEFGEKIRILKTFTLADPVLEIEYLPRVPDFTIRQILYCLADADVAFKPSVHHPLTLEERSRKMQVRERTRVLYRLGLSVVAAIPTFIIGIVLFDLVPSTNQGRRFVTQSIWSGNVSRAEWALFIIATPVYLFAADAFHRPALRELRALWRPGSKTPIPRRFYRFGSMNMLVSLGTTIAYFASVVELALMATDSSKSGTTNGLSTYFDSVVLLTMFLLVGRFIEAYSKSKTGDAVELLGKLRPTEAILVHAGGHKLVSDGDIPSTEHSERVQVDLLEVGDNVNVLHGDSPPSDGLVIRGESKFDESSLTGESRLVPKSPGDEVFSGTVNNGGPILIRVSKTMGSSMLDQIVHVVREGQARRAPIERIADALTGYFVPFVVLVAVSTWIIWMSLGLSRSLPASYLDTTIGGWPFWSLQFAIAAFVVACPCGIGLAAPTALFVGGGLAARYGILVKGGGEAFEEASHLDCIVFDKTGTLTEGGEPSITDHRISSDVDERRVLGMARSLEEQSSHPLAKAVLAFCDYREVKGFSLSDVKEIPGKGMKGSLVSSANETQPMQAIIGNQTLLADYVVEITNAENADLEAWKAQGKSVVLLALRTSRGPSDEAETGEKSPTWKLSAMFAVSDQLRGDAAATVSAIQRRGIQVWMLSGDNTTTACAVAKMVGIPAEHVIAGVLPEQKAEKVQYLQKTVPKRTNMSSRRWRSPLAPSQTRATIAMVGDGVNDSPALIQADVGIAIGSGSDVAISSAEFVLVSSKLASLLTLIDLSRVVFRRVKINFLWALVYNLIGLPVAAGVLYPVVSNGQHVRLDPVWASLAMALSSVSVVCSSLLLKSRLPLVGFRR